MGLYYPTLSAKEFFATVSELPKIDIVGVSYADWSQPIDDATYKAIASLDGRLTSLSFGEWQETKIHISMVPAIAEIKSLTWLDLGHVTTAIGGVQAASNADMDVDAIVLRKLPNLKNYHPSTKVLRPSAKSTGR